MNEHAAINRKEFIALLKSELEPTRLDMKAKPDASWIVPLALDELIIGVLENENGNQTKAAKILGITRGTLSSHIKRIDKEQPLVGITTFKSKKTNEIN